MKKTLLNITGSSSRLAKRVATAAFLTFGLGFSASAQWVVYNANELPTAFTESPFVTASVTVATYQAASTQPVVNPQFEIMPDPANPTNNILRFQILGVSSTISTPPSPTAPTSEHQSYLFRKTFSTTPTPAATVVVRAKGLPGHDRAFEMDLDFGGFRETVYIINPVNGANTGTFTFNVASGTGNTTMTAEQKAAIKDAPLNINPYEWHVYRFVKNGSSVQMYIDENPTAVATATTTAGSNNHFRIGDGSSNITVGMHLDYIIWDQSGAFSPTEKPLPTGTLLASRSDLVKKDRLGVFPNPSQGVFFVTHPAARKGAIVEIFSVSGTKVASYVAEQGNTKTDVNAVSLKSGIYTVVYNDGTQRITTRIVKG